ncbi:lipopolysaccharide biosynthesis protein RfbH [Candidatus Woesearchaeota archaeon CG10_big_fil_rev_8_21_14_0_10_44_13]|nr:MAG: lipopolysaccharide biosynthesis protein RfbH [Candidatus Woesearchaeota archaeon CG10_big_fil_rev_8_21_14_0_10_44_13]
MDDKKDLNEKRLRKEIFSKIKEFHSLKFADKRFIPGKSKVHYGGRVFDDKEMNAMADSLLDFWLTLGRYGDEFESKLARFLNVKHVLLANSGSSANLLAVSALCSRSFSRHLNPRDEVITPAVTFPTTLNPILQNNLIPVLVDVEVDTCNMDLSAAKKAITRKTKAIFVPHTLGNPNDMDEIMALSEKHGLFVIEDCCDALGSRYGIKQAGAFGHMSTFSFYPAHHITMGEGGAVATDDDELAKITSSLRSWGRACYCKWDEKNPNGTCNSRFKFKLDGQPWDHRYLYTNIGYNMKPLDLQAAMGLAQLEKLPGFIKKRKENFARLFEALSAYDNHLVLPRALDRSDVSWFAFPMSVREDAPFSRQELLEWLNGRMIETRMIFAGNIAKQPAYKDANIRISGNLGNSDTVARNSFFIGVYPGIDGLQLDWVIDSFREFMANTAKKSSR